MLVGRGAGGRDSWQRADREIAILIAYMNRNAAHELQQSQKLVA
jgi:hypothetical protein